MSRGLGGGSAGRVGLSTSRCRPGASLTRRRAGSRWRGRPRRRARGKRPLRVACSSRHNTSFPFALENLLAGNDYQPAVTTRPVHSILFGSLESPIWGVASRCTSWIET
jgi:hypothetical protein